MANKNANELVRIAESTEESVRNAATSYVEHLLDAIDEPDFEPSDEFLRSVLDQSCETWAVSADKVAKTLGVARSTVFRWRNAQTSPNQYARKEILRELAELIKARHSIP